ncbi:hypothetical protein [Bacillus sp. 2205SS5-2]|uniref:hypothetical protein n=1 Tax=Bacillus sp. 2205SS5-2 TaxID=3109031 RepID=UPI003006589F
MPASLESYSFDPSLRSSHCSWITKSGSGCQGRQASGSTRSESRFTQWADKCPSPLIALPSMLREINKNTKNLTAVVIQTQ